MVSKRNIFPMAGLMFVTLMSALSWFVEQLLAIYMLLASVPFLIFPIVGLSFYAVGKDKRTAVQRAADVTMFFLIVSVAATYDVVFATELKGIWIALLILLLLVGLIGGAQNRLRGRINFEKLVRTVWRLGFLLFAPAYVILSIVGLIQSMISL